MGAACTPAGLMIDWLLGSSTRVSVHLGSRLARTPDLPGIDWDRWCDDWIPDGMAPDGHAFISLPRDRRRDRVQLIFADRSGRPEIVAKFSRNPHTRLEQAVRARMRQLGPLSFLTPRPLAEGEVDGWHFSVDQAVDAGFHRPASLSPDKRRRVVGEYQSAFADLVARPGRLVHGDFAPWNVREAGGGGLIVFDWEEVGAGPELADELWHVINTQLVRRSGPSQVAATARRQLPTDRGSAIAEAAEFWLRRLNLPEPPEVGGVAARGRQARFAAAQKQVLETLVRL
jgi:hypothetical protein